MSNKKDKHYRKLTEKKVKNKYSEIVADTQKKFISDILSMPFRDRWKFGWLIIKKIDPWEWSRKQRMGEV